MLNDRDFSVVIPARFESQRLPGKVLLDINGKTMLQRVWERAQASAASQVVIATDDQRVLEAASAFGAQAVMTSPAHTSGSDRIAECADMMSWPGEQLIVNLQGDEPQMPPDCLQQVADLLARHDDAVAASLYWPIGNGREARDPNVVKVVLDQAGAALMFSRSPLPFARGYTSIEDAMADGVHWFRHLGLYAYRAASLRTFSRTGPTPLEQAERLEQLRYLETGGKIVMEQACLPIPAGVDTQDDLDRIREIT
jgi:3-deoxy-manno-octulosonate cytidylyltransferase (CMP-KDO synthetase)